MDASKAQPMNKRAWCNLVAIVLFLVATLGALYGIIADAAIDWTFPVAMTALLFTTIGEDRTHPVVRYGLIVLIGYAIATLIWRL